MWKYEYNETGGYDSMTGSFDIFQNNKLMFVIDQKEFGQSPCIYNRMLEVEYLAKSVVKALNKNVF